MMTVLIIADNIGMGGKERRMLELIKSLSADPKYKIVLITLLDRGTGYKYISDFNITHIEAHRKNKWSLMPFVTLWKAVKKYKPDVVHAWGSLGCTYMLPSLLFRKFTFINSIIADAPAKVAWYNKVYFRGQLSFLFSDVILSNSLAGIESYNAPRYKSYCIYNGIDMNRFKNLPDAKQLKKELGIEEFSFVAGMVGVFHPRKDYHTYVKAAQKVIASYKDICFLLVGDGQDRNAIEAMLSDADKKNIRLLGKRSDVEALIQTFDVGVLCTNSQIHGEGVSNSLIEYMSLQKPALATTGGGTPEVIEDGKNGYLLEFANADMLAEKITYLYSHPVEKLKMGEAALDTIHQKFLLDRMKHEFLAVYQKKMPQAGFRPTGALANF
jgi:glycosyltransferase involved in cell wall biosynthesis